MKLKLKKQMKIKLTFRVKTTTIWTVVLKQAMDELTETNNFNLWKHRKLLYPQIKVKSRNAV